MKYYDQEWSESHYEDRARRREEQALKGKRGLRQQ